MEKETSSTCSSQPTAPRSAAEIAEKWLGEINWVTAGIRGFCECPGKKQHSTHDGKKDCMVYLDRVPTLHCVHGSCSEKIGEMNSKLRAAILNPHGDHGFVPPRLTEGEKERIRQREKEERLRLRAKYSRETILRRHRWTYEEMIDMSPVKVSGNEPEHWKMLLEKFLPDDVVWIGDKTDSGKPEHARHFKTAMEWRGLCAPPGPLICPVTFKNISQSRSNENVIDRRFLVIESDTLGRDEVGAVFKWLMDKVGLGLQAVVDTGGKSLHAWFEFDEVCKESFEDLKLVLPALECDPKMFTASQPVRLPGVLRDVVQGKYQKLVYMKDGGVE